MTYNARESSTYDGKPVELYEFRNGNMVWRYTSGDTPQDYLSGTFIPEAIERDRIMESQEVSKLGMKIRVPSDNPIAEMFRFIPPTDITTLVIYRKHRDDAEVTVQWIGRVVNSEYMGITSELHGEPATTSIRRNGLRRHYQRQCPHVLYGADCRVNKALHLQVASVVSKLGLTVTINRTFTNNLFAGGMLAWDAVQGKQWRFITGNTGNTVRVNLPFLPDTDQYGRGLPNGTSLELYPGCKHTMTDCINRFGNLNNYGGYPYIPMANPFNMTTMY